MAGKKGGGGKTIAIVAGGCGCLVAVGGIVAAIAIPQYTKYIAESKASEADANVRVIFTGVEGAYHAVGAPAGLGDVPEPELPPSLPRTPPTPPCGTKQLWPTDAPEGWDRLGFAPADPLYYAYEYERGADGRAFVVRAVGDLDCDGELSLHEMRGTVDASGEISRGPMVMQNELE